MRNSSSISPNSTDEKMDNCSPRSIENKSARRLPMVPTRKQTNVPPKIPPPNRVTPPALPSRSQQAFESRKLQKRQQQQQQHQQHLNNTPFSHKTSLENVQELYSRPIGFRRNMHKPPPLNQVHHSKVNQRQDSNISSDSFSATSSPGYSNKNMEAPLLQHTSKMNRSTMRGHQLPHQQQLLHQQTNPNTACNATPQDTKQSSLQQESLNPATVRSVPPRVSMRQDSSISSDSFSQTSSPSYNTKIMEAPLLSHAARMPKVSKSIAVRNLEEEIAKESAVDNNGSSVIIKSASTPASLQTIVRLSNGSNVSLQGKVIIKDSQL